MPKKKKAVSLAGTKPKVEKSGPDGTVIQSRRLNTGTQAIATIKVRCRPGTFEWRYGRFGNVQYHAGAQFAQLCERAGIASAGNFSLEGGGGGSAPGGMTDARVVALDKLRKLSAEIGGPMQRRLLAYCVDGRTPKEIAASFPNQVTDRQVADTLDIDLHELARAMQFA